MRRPVSITKASDRTLNEMLRDKRYTTHYHNMIREEQKSRDRTRTSEGKNRERAEST